MIHQCVYCKDAITQTYQIYFVHATKKNYKVRVMALIMSKLNFETLELFEVIREVEKLKYQEFKSVNVRGIDFMITGFNVN